MGTPLPVRCPASLYLPLGGTSCSTAMNSSLRTGMWCIPPTSRALCGVHSTRSSRFKVAAQYDRQDDSRGSRSPRMLDERYRERGQYDYPPPSGNFRGAQPPTEDSSGGNNGNGNDSGGSPNGGGGMDNFTKALIAGAFIMGMGTGVWFNSEATFYPSNVASTEVIDRHTPNSEVCMANGYSSMVFDERVFVSFNPFNVYVAQPEVKPGCVLRRANIGLLEKKKLVTDKEVSACTKSMNTFGFVGDLNKSPEVSCVYHSEDGENQFLRDPKKSVMGDGFQPHELQDGSGSTTQLPAQN